MSSIYFKCVLYERGCRGRAVYKYTGRFRETQYHNHEPDPDFVGERHFRENILNEIEGARYVNYQEVLDQYRSDQRFLPLLTKINSMVRVTEPPWNVLIVQFACFVWRYSRKVRCKMTLRRLRSTMYKTRMNKYPNIPHTMRELTQVLLANNHLSKTIDVSENLYAGSVTATDGSHHIAFFSPRMLRFMSKLKLIQGDGTFSSRPALPSSRQLFVLVTTWDNFVS